MKTNVPIALTLSRIAAIPLLIACAAARTPTGDLLASFTFSAAAATDYVDGLIARSRNQQTELGRMLDPIADKLLVAAALMMLIGHGAPTLVLYPATVIILREIVISGLREFLASVSKSLPTTRLSKWKTGFQMVGIVVMLAVGPPSTPSIVLGLPLYFAGETLLLVAAILTCITGWNYIMCGLRLSVFDTVKSRDRHPN